MTAKTRSAESDVASVTVVVSGAVTLAMFDVTVVLAACDAALNDRASTLESIRDIFSDPEGACWQGESANDMK